MFFFAYSLSIIVALFCFFQYLVLLPHYFAKAGFKLLILLLSLKRWNHIQPMSVDNIYCPYLLQVNLECLLKVTSVENLVSKHHRKGMEPLRSRA